MDDMELLQEYASRGSEDAFATLVSRHIDMVYSVALRHVGNLHNAQEVTQAVFIILARKSRALRRETILSGWLFQTARLTAANFLRSETRRTHREKGAYMESSLHEGGDSAWKQIAPFLNDAISSLDEKDRNSIVLRYIKGMSLKEVGAALGWSEDAAKKRVSRAVEKLRIFFARRNVTLSGAVLTGGIAAHSVEAAPAGLALEVTAAALKGTALTTSTSILVKGTLQAMAWAKAKIAVAAGVVALVAVQSYEIASRNKELASLRRQALAQNAKSAAESARTDSQELEQLRADQMNLSNEVLKLREQLASTKPRETKPPQPVVKLSQNAGQENPGRVRVSETTEEALDIYTELTGRTVLRPGKLPQLPVSIKADLPADTNAAVARVVSELAKCHLDVVPDGETFVRVLPEDWQNSLMGKQLAQINPPLPSPHPADPSFYAVVRSDFAACLDIYSNLRGRTILYPLSLPRAAVSFRNRKPLTTEEAVYALTVVLAMNGVAAVDDGDHFVQLVPLEKAEHITPKAPKPKPGAPLLDPSKLPSVADPSTVQRAPEAGTVSISDRLTMLYARLIANPPPPASWPLLEVDRLVGFYAGLTGRNAMASVQFGHTLVPFEIQTPLTDTEVLYAIETTLALNNLAIIPVDDGSIRAGDVSERRKLMKDPSEGSRKP